MTTKRSPLSFKGSAPRGALAALACALAFAAALAPGAHAQKEVPGSVSGRVTDGERGVMGITVTLLSADPTQRFRTVARVKTDGEGRYLLPNVPPGRYQLTPHAPAFVVQGATDSYPPGRPLTLLSGEEVKDFDFRVERGAVITGRVTDDEGNPVVAEQVAVTPVEVAGQPPPQPVRGALDPRDLMTDDRGVYRIYGLSAGRYRVSVGQAGEGGGGGALNFGRRKIFQRTFYPGVTEQAQARVVEVKAGDEAENVDITLGRPVKTFRASGRFVSAETGEPVPNVAFGYGTLDPSGRRVGSFGGGGRATNARGEFVTEGLAPGRYVVFNMPGTEGTDFYTEPASFEIADADVSGVVVRVRRGASVSGVVQIEGVSDRAMVARLLPQLRVYAWVEARNQTVPPFSSRPPQVNPDGSFRVGGLRQGKLHIGATAETVKGLSLTRVEVNGTNVTRGFDIADGAQLTGVRIVLSYGTSVIVGQTSFVNGAPPEGSRLVAQAHRAGAPAGAEMGRTVEADARGHFRIEGLPAGSYEITVRAYSAGQMHRSEPLNVSIPEGAETRVTPVMDFTPKPRGERP